jgi:hypothetical protein
VRRAAWLFAIASLLSARDGGGIRPRGAGRDYPVHETIRGLTVAAAAIAPDQVRKLFATDLNRGGYLVVEVAVYPDQGREADLSAGDFMLQIGSESLTMRPASARAIASALQDKNTPRQQRGSDVTIYPTATIGYESGGYDPATGVNRRGGVYTATGVGVAVGAQGPAGPPKPGSTDRDRATMQQELEDKALPEGKTSHAVAGYLFFPRPAGKLKNAVWELTYYGEGGKIRLLIPPPAMK